MRTNLEEKLAAYEKTTPITNDEELLRALDTIIEEQIALPPEEKDTDLLDEAIEAALSLRGEDLSSLEELSLKIASASVNEKKAKNPTKIKTAWHGFRCIAASVAVVIILTTSVIGFTAGYNWIHEMLYSSLKDSEKKEVVLTAMSKEYDNLADMVKEFNISGVLLPHTLPEGLGYSMITAQVSYAKPIEGEEPVASSMFDIRTSGDCSWQEVYIETVNLGTTAEGEMREIGGREVTYYMEFGRHCAFFTHNGYTYTISATEYSELEKMLKALR